MNATVPDVTVDPLKAALDAFYEMQNGTAPTPAPSSLVTFKPMKSRALKVHPSQVNEARDFAAKNGVPTEYTADGHPVITSSRQFRALAKISGFRHQGYVWALLAVLVGSAARGEHARPPVPHTPEPPAACRMPVGDPEPDPLAAELAAFVDWTPFAAQYADLGMWHYHWALRRRQIDQDRPQWEGYCGRALWNWTAWHQLSVALGLDGWREPESRAEALDWLIEHVGPDGAMPPPLPCWRWEAGE